VGGFKNMRIKKVLLVILGIFLWSVCLVLATVKTTPPISREYIEHGTGDKFEKGWVWRDPITYVQIFSFLSGGYCLFLGISRKNKKN
jgi:hypothetical protein